ncbi:MAG: CHAT domain-containing protein [Blastocatellia bacterium]
MNQYVRVIIEEPDAGLNVRLINPDRQQVYAYTLRRDGTLPMSALAEHSGAFALAVWAAEDQGAPVNYRLRVDEMREAGPQDRVRILADEAFAEAEELRGQWNFDSFNRALEKYKEAQSHWLASNNPRNQAEVLLAAGELHALLSENDKALEYFGQALSIARRDGHRRIEIEALNGIGAAYVELSDSENVFKHSYMARALSQEMGDRKGEAAALNNIGLAHYLSSDLRDSIDYFNQALNLCTLSGDRRGEAQALNNLGYCYQDMGSLRKALGYYDKALGIWQSIDDRRGKAFALTSCGNAYAFLGEKQKALTFHNQAAEFFRGFGDRNGEATVLNGIGFVYDDLGEKEKALDFYDRSVELSRASGNRNLQCLAIGYIGRVYDALGQKQKALEYFEQRLQLSKEIGDSRIEAYTLRDIGAVYESLGKETKAMRYYKRVLALNQALGDRQGQAYTLNYIGHLYNSLGDKRRALYNYNKALPLIQAVEDRRGETLTLHNISRINRDLGNLKEAFAKVDALLKIVESLRTKITGRELRSSYFASLHQHYELCIDVLMRMHSRRPSQGFDAAALEISERGRARTLLDMLVEAKADIRQGVDPGLFEREQSVQHALNAKAELRMRLLNSKDKERQAESIEREIQSLATEYQEIQAQIRERSPRYAALTQPVPLKVSEIQKQALDEETILLEFSLGDEASYLWAVSQTSIKSYKLPARDTIEELSKKVYDAITARQPLPGETAERYNARIAANDSEYYPIAARLSQTLLGQAADVIANKRLLIVAEGALQYIPFAALPIPDNQGQQSHSKGGPSVKAAPLIVEHEIISLPSASALALSRRETAGRAAAKDAIAVFADPVFSNDDPRVSSASHNQPSPPSETEFPIDLTRALTDAGIGSDEERIPRLPSTRKEAEAILEFAPGEGSLLALDFDANLDRVISPDLTQYRFIHLATHGVLDNAHPELSGIVFSLVDEQGRPRDGFLRLHDVYNLNLRADLVVLSACNTGIGKDIKGEGLIGLMRGFMYAGVPRVVASFWRVDDLATTRLMRLFYRGLFKERLMPAAALRAAQIEMWESGRWNSPFYWAGFGLQGEWR